MPTDGADFQRRRPLYGRFFVDIKQGASDDRLVTSGCLGIACEITKDRQMPMFRPMVDALVAIRPGENLFVQDFESYEAAVSTAIAAVAGQFPVCEAVRDLECLISAGISDAGEQYSFDLLSKGIPRKLHDARGLTKLGSLAWRLRCCHAKDPESQFLLEFPEWISLSADSAAALGMPKAEFRQQFIALQLRFLDEWHTFVARIPHMHRNPLPAAA
jgi:hypothetical protein